ncbi:fumarylacetoacetate hydrolase family protein [Shouchella clausii]|uniref:Fumarylacetoacetate hydrolase n=1 Tax=Shouchella clausii TaxID=79880 RepID=A0A268NVM8_SHOCL|nr:MULTISPECIES: fumarylacetoacetate hydrolase family protein [Shouchella]SPT77729.1 catabolic enzyme [Niallia circulans]ALA51711.1 Fumarylacetoacetate hydrolase family protein [Shouchella clausii]MBU3232242.1 fumarylacetoacetate hydrolase family protein [Shouchella clausii]MBU3264532.1 fumarylacetoacetate hydrolase family protein [Shouchella clausii]MBU3508348.1 fumarylacetoacetate hydrolase family protein [Shouchella clausii]
MKFIRFKDQEHIVHSAIGQTFSEMYVVPFDNYVNFYYYLKENAKTAEMYIKENSLAPVSIEETALEIPIEADEVWASGVTYMKSREARNYEATNGKLDVLTFYDKVYDAERPEIFLKSTARRTQGPNKELLIRSDSNWQIPEPELGLVIGEGEEIIGYTLGNDMSCRDIEGENPLYLPQAKVWKKSCSIGPAILMPTGIENPYELSIMCTISREHEVVFQGSASVSQLKRKLEELVEFLIRDNDIVPGTVLLTGTCIVPDNDFTLAVGDVIDISSTPIGTLKNYVGSFQK